MGELQKRKESTTIVRQNWSLWVILAPKVVVMGTRMPTKSWGMQKQLQAFQCTLFGMNQSLCWGDSGGELHFFFFLHLEA